MYTTSPSPKALKKENRFSRAALLFLVLVIFAVVVFSLTAMAGDSNAGLNINKETVARPLR